MNNNIKKNSFNKIVFLVEFFFILLIFLLFEEILCTNYSINNVQSKKGQIEHISGITLKTIQISLKDDLCTYFISGYKKGLIDYDKIYLIKKNDVLEVFFLKKQALFYEILPSGMELVGLNHEVYGKILDFNKVFFEKKERKILEIIITIVYAIPLLLLLYSYFLCYLMIFNSKKYNYLRLHPLVRYKIKKEDQEPLP